MDTSEAPATETAGDIDMVADAETKDTEDASQKDNADAADGDSSSAPTAVAPDPNASKATKAMLNAYSDVVRNLSEAVIDDIQISGPFQRIPLRKSLPDYYEIIQEPMAFSTIRGKILKKQYSNDAKEFVRDLALIPHNAQVYNRPSAQITKDALELRRLIKEELQALVEDEMISADDAALPDLGEIPDFEESPPGSDEEEEDDDDDDDDDEESDEDGPKKRGRKAGRRASTLAKPQDNKEDGGKSKTRGRPPKVETAMEKRISALLKGLRKFKSSEGGLKIAHFEKLPDKTLLPEYYQEVKNPIAMDQIKRKSKRKKYASVDHALADLNIMFENAKAYNIDSSIIYRDAADLQKEAKLIAESEKAKPDSAFVDEDGRLPLSQILFNDEIYKVGDWVHLRNDNDMTKPIPAQIYRTWRDSDGRDWINACWYFRPEQTVHRFEKHFFENEVVKTGRYEDHPIDDVVSRCFVMFFTRYFKGRPRGLPAGAQVYVCEARYNEVLLKLNKIKTWASCVPDEVREKDYEMDLFDIPRKMRKYPSPIRYLLKDGAKDTDPLPQPTWGASRGPPTIGNVHRRPRDANESPPPEATPSPPPGAAPSPVRRPPPSQLERPRPDSQGNITMAGTAPPAGQSPRSVANPLQSAYAQNMANSGQRPTATPASMVRQASFGSVNPAHGAASNMMHAPSHQYNQYASNTPTHQTPSHSYNSRPTMPNPAARPAPLPAPPPPAPSSSYLQPRQHEVYRFEDAVNAQIPEDIRSQFHQDEAGRILWYTSPPNDANPVPEGKRSFGHSLRYLADKARNKDADATKRVVHEAELAASRAEDAKRAKLELRRHDKDTLLRGVEVVEMVSRALDRSTDGLYRVDDSVDGWQAPREAALQRLRAQQVETARKEAEVASFHAALAAERSVKFGGLGL